MACVLQNCKCTKNMIHTKKDSYEKIDSSGFPFCIRISTCTERLCTSDSRYITYSTAGKKRKTKRNKNKHYDLECSYKPNSNANLRTFVNKKMIECKKIKTIKY